MSVWTIGAAWADGAARLSTRPAPRARAFANLFITSDLSGLIGVVRRTGEPPERVDPQLHSPAGERPRPGPAGLGHVERGSGGSRSLASGHAPSRHSPESPSLPHRPP